MKYLAPLVTLFFLSACGKSENEIRSEERVKILEEQLAEKKLKNLETQVEEIQTANSRKNSNSDSIVKTRSTSSVNISLSKIGSYTAFIGEDDLYNSSGKRLTQPWAILRQDRANFHKFGIRQSGDSSDTLFRNVRNRARMERMIRNGSTSAAARNAIVSGGVVVKVEVLGNGSQGKSVNVTVYR